MTENDFSQLADDYLMVTKAIESVPDKFLSRTGLNHLSKNLNLLDKSINDLFQRWASITPNQFFQFLTHDHSRRKLTESRNRMVFESLSIPERSGHRWLNAPSVHLEAMTPEEFKLRGAGMKILYGFHPTPFGECFLARTERGISYLAFVEPHGCHDLTLNQFRQFWPGAILSENSTETGILVMHIFEPDHSGNAPPLHLLMKGTDFQISVWQALLRIPSGSIVSYEDVAVGIGHPKAVRAVGNAVAANPVGYLVPCHRVIAKSGRIHRYGWGIARKKAMLGREAAAAAASTI